MRRSTILFSWARFIMLSLNGARHISGNSVTMSSFILEANAQRPMLGGEGGGIVVAGWLGKKFWFESQTANRCATNQYRTNDRSTLRTLQATEQIQNQNDYENGYDYAVRPVAESITASRESPD
jgi:hypothetical protein